MKEKVTEFKHVIILYSFIFLVWGFYRFLFKLPDEIEETILKPIIWLTPTLFLLNKEGGGLSSLGWTGKNLFKSLYISIGLGVLFASLGVVANSIKYGGINFVALSGGTATLFAGLGLSSVTAISEETTFRGFIFARLWKIFKNEWAANVITTAGWVIVHIPVVFFVLKLDPTQVLIFLFLTSVFGFGSAFLFARTGNIISSILLHVFWEWPIILFR